MTTDKAIETRRLLLEAAASEVLENGFRSTSLDRILEKTGVTKGALYYHFKNKKDLGLALIDEVYREQAVGMWREALGHGGDPVDVLIDLLKQKRAAGSLDSIRCGCPLNNLAQEMASVDEDFRQRIESVFQEWRATIADALEQGKAGGAVRPNADTVKAAVFITAVIEGAVGAAKNARDPAMLDSAMETLLLFVETLRPGRYVRSSAAVT